MKRPKPYPHPDAPPIDPERYVMIFDSGGLDYLEALDGVDWNHCVIPPEDHECWEQVRGLAGSSGGHSPECVSRCGCGAISLSRPYEVKAHGRYWQERNTRVAKEKACLSFSSFG